MSLPLPHTIQRLYLSLKWKLHFQCTLLQAVRVWVTVMSRVLSTPPTTSNVSLLLCLTLKWITLSWGASDTTSWPAYHLTHPQGKPHSKAPKYKVYLRSDPRSRTKGCGKRNHDLVGPFYGNLGSLILAGIPSETIWGTPENSPSEGQAGEVFIHQLVCSSVKGLSVHLL